MDRGPVNTNSNMTSFLHFVNKRVIYRLGIISLAHASVHTFKPGNKIIKYNYLHCC